jgi:hypothetical protein
MLRLCPHDFLWPRRVAHGDYYQVCRLCGAEYKYDWASMRRGERTNVKPGPTSASGGSRSSRSAGRRPAPRLSLLLELEPAHRVFFRNLADILFFRRTPPIATTSRPAPFWPDVFVHSVVPWGRFSESLLYHMIALAAVFILSQHWAQPDQPSQRSAFRRSYVTYYTPSQTFPALRGSQTPFRPPKKKREPARQAAMKVAAERAPGSIRPPDIKLPGPAQPSIVASNLVAPAMPLAATSRSQLTVPAGPTSVVAPPPDVNQAASRRSGLLQATVVGPAPEVGGFASRPGMSVPSAIVVAPAPMVQASMRRVGDIDIGPSAVVAPAPRLPTDERHLMSGSGHAPLGGSVALAVPPPPSVQRSGPLAGGRVGSLSGTGLQAVAPTPLVQDAANSSGGRSRNSLSSAGLQAVPPPPTMQEGGNTVGTGRSSSLSGAGLQGLQPAPPGQNGGSSDSGERQVAMNIHPAISPASPPAMDNPREPSTREPATEELPLRVIGLALALPNSSFFSNYEVFIAEKRLRNRGQLIKLVYVSLPYQRRLSEYGVDNSKVYRLRVTRDRTCDESLLEMTWPETDPRPNSKNSADSPALSQEDRNNMLPCYRTTADDYRRAISRRR